MGVLNVTPDSFSDGGNFLQPQQAVEHALQMIESGADVIDIGGESTRPGAAGVSQQEELDRVLPVIEELRRRHDIPISIDTCKSAVAEAALKAGADIINDISAARFDKEILTIARDYQAGFVLMHIKGTPQDMQKNPSYQDVMEEILTYLAASVQSAVESGISADRIVVDPGIGFGKRWFDNYDIINRLFELRILQLPILTGVSRKSFLGRFSEQEAKNRFAESIAANIMAIRGGANILRVHDVAETKRAVKIVDIFRMRALGIEPEGIEGMFYA
ncbi:MAG TPA: dihydropteroate synthase [Bacteroidetes bacterium]|nr:dihydropteroate synthase [Bacteroidota bacterium]